MQVEQFKILRAARAIGEQGFTKPEILARADVGRAALDSFFRRSGVRFFEKTGMKRAGGEGSRSADIWRIRRDVMHEVIALLDEGRTDFGRSEINPEAALTAIENNHARWQARVSLFDAVDAGEGLVRERHLGKCSKWIANEERRHRHWGRAASVPDEIRFELRDLKRRRDAIECNIDRLAAQRPMPSFRDAFDWLRNGATRYNEGDPEAFAPLCLSKHARPSKLLAEATLLCCEFDGCARERFIVALVAILPSLAAGRARKLICDTLDLLGPEVGTALVEGVDRARPSGRKEALDQVPGVLVGFQSYPQLLTRTHFELVRRWFDNLPYRSDWNEQWAPLWAELGPYTFKNSNAVRNMLCPQSEIPVEVGRTTLEEMRGVFGSAYDRIYQQVERQITNFYKPPAPPVAGDWLQGYGPRAA
ncbi:hypothetical protein [uncultured Roseobacter sp.]|uniref:hypothetical protein n=1 Tax=uncultured Roseobacter sp. TaxID=114847 RepID=UPI0026364873|nr:hypothetical protein [uncultured Roseobacter sp.]